MASSHEIPKSNQGWKDEIDRIFSIIHSRSVKNQTLSIPKPGSPEFAQVIDHTLLDPQANEENIRLFCKQYASMRYKTCMIRPQYVPLAVSLLDEEVGGIVSTVIDFPDGGRSTEERIMEAKQAVQDGARELDMVINYNHLKSGEYIDVYQDLAALRSVFPRGLENSGQDPEITLKIILETSQLSPYDIVAGTVIASEANFDFVKTSTGFKGEGAKVENVRLMRDTANVCGQGLQVKASGGMKTVADAVFMLEAGATRLGLSRSDAIMKEGSQLS